MNTTPENPESTDVESGRPAGAAASSLQLAALRVAAQRKSAAVRIASGMVEGIIEPLAALIASTIALIVITFTLKLLQKKEGSHAGSNHNGSTRGGGPDGGASPQA